VKPFHAIAALALGISPSLVHAQATPAVRVVGDSHVERLGPMIDQAVRDAGYESLGHLARRGWSTGRYVRTGDLRERLAEGGRPDVVVVSLGGNDRCASRIVYRKQLAWIVDEARAAGAERVVWLGPAASDVERSEYAEWVGGWHERNAEWQQEILPDLGVEWIDSRPLTRGGQSDDGIHFTREAYAAWCADALAQARLLPPCTPDERA
jgi:lysophospholipase L1-like esterase